jgi:hypothetical protein
VRRITHEFRALVEYDDWDEVLGEKLAQCLFAHHKSHTDHL